MGNRAAQSYTIPAAFSRMSCAAAGRPTAGAPIPASGGRPPGSESAGRARRPRRVVRHRSRSKRPFSANEMPQSGHLRNVTGGSVAAVATTVERGLRQRVHNTGASSRAAGLDGFMSSCTHSLRSRSMRRLRRRWSCEVDSSMTGANKRQSKDTPISWRRSRKVQRGDFSFWSRAVGSPKAHHPNVDGPRGMAM